MQLGPGQLSPRLKQQAAWLSAYLPFKQAQAVFVEIGYIRLSHSQIWRESQEAGEKFKEYEAQKSAAGMRQPKRNESAVLKLEPDLRLGASLDGGMIHLRREGWKEFKAGCVYQIETCSSYDPQAQSWQDLAHARDNTYVAHLGGPEEIGQLLWAEAEARGWNKASESQIMGDGAKWIWGIAQTHFYDSRQTVDWYHASSHLHQAAKLLYPDDDQQQSKWLKTQKTRLYQGHAQAIAQDLADQVETIPQADTEGLQAEAGYFLNNHKRMAYLFLREEHFLIGSGTIESGIKQFKTRFCGPGMRWSRAGAARMLALRSAVLSDYFHLNWHLIHNSPPP